MMFHPKHALIKNELQKLRMVHQRDIYKDNLYLRGSGVSYLSIQLTWLTDS